MVVYIVVQKFTNFKFITMSKTSKRGRDAGTGQFVSITYANKHPKTTVVENIKVGPVKKQK